MAELGILLAAVCLLAVVIDWIRGIEVTGYDLAQWFLSRGDRIVNTRTGKRYVVVDHAYDRDVLRVRRCLRG